MTQQYQPIEYNYAVTFRHRHPLLSYPYVKDAPWPDGSDNRFEQGTFFMYPIPFVVTMEELLAAGQFPIYKEAKSRSQKP